MVEETNKQAPKWFMVVAAVLLVWNLIGVMAYIAQVMMSPESLAALPDEQRQIIENTPAWATAAFAIGAAPSPGNPGLTNTVESWNGSSWSANPNALPSARSGVDCVGTATAGLVFGGIIPPSGTKQTATFSFDGTSFSAGGDLITATAESHATAGSQTAALVAGGYAPAASTKTELYNGTSWSTTTSMTTARGGAAGLGSNSVSTAALAAGGNNPGGDLNATEEFTGETSALNIKTLTTS